MTDYYAILGISSGSDFQEIKRAYYRQAKQCHPDLFGGHPAKGEQFKRLVEAFNTLSDPLSRALYDQKHVSTAQRVFGDPIDEWSFQASILDTPADDILEELMVGNTIPRNTTLQTLLLDMERTDRFCMFREAKTLFYTGQIHAAAELFDRYLALAPLNILGHYYRGRCCAQRGRHRAAARAFAEAIRIGNRRQPPLHLPRIRRELHQLRRTKLGWISRVQLWWSPPPDADTALTPDAEMRRDVTRAIRNIERNRAQQQRRQLGQ